MPRCVRFNQVERCRTSQRVGTVSFQRRKVVLKTKVCTSGLKRLHQKRFKSGFRAHASLSADLIVVFWRKWSNNSRKLISSVTRKILESTSRLPKKFLQIFIVLQVLKSRDSARFAQFSIFLRYHRWLLLSKKLASAKY